MSNQAEDQEEEDDQRVQEKVKRWTESKTTHWRCAGQHVWNLQCRHLVLLVSDQNNRTGEQNPKCMEWETRGTSEDLEETHRSTLKLWKNIYNISQLPDFYFFIFGKVNKLFHFLSRVLHNNFHSEIASKFQLQRNGT